MKEVTYGDWQKNPTPRMMWVWDSSENNKKQRKVIYLVKPKFTYPVVALSEDETAAKAFKHCAEIEEPKTRRMSNQELAWWLQEGKHREYKFPDINIQLVRSYFEYDEAVANDEVYGNILIRENGGEWHEPLVEVEE